MGSSGGSGRFLGGIKPDKFVKKIRKAEEKSTTTDFNCEVNNYLNSQLPYINDRPIDEIKKHLDSIKKAIESEIENSIDLIYGGSTSKHTYVDGLSDIDMLAVLNRTELANKNPQEVLDYFIKKLKERLPKTQIEKGNLAITVTYSDKIQIQILPALKTSTGLKIASPDGTNTWSNVIKPNKFAEQLHDVNSRNNQKVVPIIKLAKSIISNLSEKRQISGYHTESIAIEAFRDYQGPIYPKDMLKHFFEYASKKVLTAIKDRTNQSIHVDDYLGSNNSTQRRNISDSLAQIARKMNNADGAQQTEMWKSIFEK